MTKTVLAAVIAAIGMATVASAECRTRAFVSYPPQNDSVFDDQHFDSRLRLHSSVLQLEQPAIYVWVIESRPSHGTLAQTGMVEFSYTPRRGFKGADRYSVRICGRSRSGSGCSTITYDMAVE